MVFCIFHNDIHVDVFSKSDSRSRNTLNTLYDKKKLIAQIACLETHGSWPWGARGTVRNAGSSSRKRKPCGRSRGPVGWMDSHWRLVSFRSMVGRSPCQLACPKNRQVQVQMAWKKYIPMFYILLSRFLWEKKIVHVRNTSKLSHWQKVSCTVAIQDLCKVQFLVHLMKDIHRKCCMS